MAPSQSPPAAAPDLEEEEEEEEDDDEAEKREMLVAQREAPRKRPESKFQVQMRAATALVGGKS